MSETYNTSDDALNNSEQEAGKEPRKRKFSHLVTALLNGEFLTRDGMIKHMPYILFLVALFLLYIFMGYQFELIERRKVQTKRHLEELSAEYKTLKSELESRKQQSNVARDIASLGLIEPLSPPPVIEVDPKNFEE
ncbi:MAG: hypothetical protein RL226_131 [Bacteroidota bacterium]|jgi:hypothetical protein